jgi:hypothetical protein
LGKPLLPFPLIVKLPPAPKVPPPARLPEINGAVVNVIVPRVPLMGVPLNPVKLVKVEFESVNVLLVDVIFPPVLLKTRLLLVAQADTGRHTASNAMRTNLFMNTLLGLARKYLSCGGKPTSFWMTKVISGMAQMGDAKERRKTG